MSLIPRSYGFKKIIGNIPVVVLVITWTACSDSSPGKNVKSGTTAMLKMDSLYALSTTYFIKGQPEKSLPLTRYGLKLATIAKNDSQIAKFCGQMEQLHSLKENPDKDSADFYHHLMLEHARLSKNNALIFKALEYQKRMFGRAALYDSAIHVTKERLRLAKEMNDSIAMMEMEEDLGNQYDNDVANIDLAYQHYNNALELCLLLKKSNADSASYRAKKIRIEHALLLYDIADLFTRQKNYAKGLVYYEELNRIIPESRKPHNPALFIGLGECYEGLKQQDSAIKYYKIAIEYSQNQFFFDDHNQNAYRKYGDLLTRQGKPEGGDYLQKALMISWKLDRQDLILDSRQTLGAYYILQKKWKPASDTLQAAVLLAKKLKRIDVLVTIYQNLSLLYERQSDYKTALDYSKLARQYGDSLQTEKFTSLATEMDVKYQSYENSQKIILLQKDIRIQQLQLQTTRRTRIFYILGALALLSIGGIIYYYRNKQQRARHHKVKVELENKALRAQMNPHFIFNSLNAIQELIVTENYSSSYEYLSKFSRLLRMVLHNSEKNFIPLNQEIEMYQLYLELESLRFKHAFSYTITIAPQIDTDNILFPTLLMQPVIENALWHGLSQKQGEKLLGINFEEREGTLLCTVTDNGIGREKAAAIKTAKIGTGHLESKGILLVQQRIETLKADLGRHASLDITDGRDAAGIPCGTKVEVQFSVMENI